MSTPTFRKRLALVLIALVMAAESVYFGRLCLAGFARLKGERAFFRNDMAASWAAYHASLGLGGRRAQIEVDLIELLLFALDQREAGLEAALPLSDDRALSEARTSLARSIRRTPYRAFLWSMAADLFFRQARESRRSQPIDLSAISENPLENLDDADWWGFAALEKAAALEPQNYIYDDLAAEQYLDAGVVEEAARACWRAVASYPRLDGHRYLTRPDLPQSVLDAAVEGFEAAAAGPSLIARVDIEVDTGRLLAAHQQAERALPYLERSVRMAPDLYDPRMEVAMSLIRLERPAEAVPHLTKAATLRPEDPFPHYYLGVILAAMKEHPAALEQFLQARILGHNEPKFYHALGVALESAGQVKEAERQFTAAAHLNADDPFVWSELLAFHLRQGNARAARQDCERLEALGTEADWGREQCVAVRQEDF